MYIEKKKIENRRLTMEMLETPLASVWPELDPKDPTSKTELSTLCKDGAALRVFSDIKGGVSANHVRENEALDADGILITMRASTHRVYSDCLPLHHALLALSQWVPIQETSTHESAGLGSSRAVSKLLFSFVLWTGSTVTSYTSLSISAYNPLIMLSLRAFRVSRSLRNMESSYLNPLLHSNSDSGLELSREYDTLRVPDKVGNSGIHEYRTTLCISLFPDQHRRRVCYSIVDMTDAKAELSSIYHLTEDRAASPYRPLYVYLSCVREALDIIRGGWTLVLDNLDAELNVTLEQLSTVDGLNDLLFDDLDLSTSRQYFVLLQHLRIYERWMIETSEGLWEWYNQWDRDLDKLVRVFNVGPDSYDLSRESQQSRELLLAWEETAKDAQQKLEPLLQRIRSKRQDIVTLRDGLFNATAVREAMQGSQLNQQGLRLNRYVFIFTITTIIYLPLSFVTGFFGMNNLAGTSLSSSMKPFAVMVVAFCLGTYVLTFGSLGLYTYYENIRRERDELRREREKLARRDGTFGETDMHRAKQAREEEHGSTGFPGNFARRAKSAFWNDIPLKSLRPRRRREAATAGQA
ncbi:hypothetical protein EDD37DRAFT_75716 [Exophiala viscosa]|uniref:uncharacterized protein n=1 Tax=Exophiala viscosa TaxID=2486360 RepID=UPI002198BE46|nr:hypothetical protein EDD37DRAFT_75716 [Exophiala viscosa]